MPSFSLTAMVGVGVPLFVVTMASQNLPGIAAIRAAGYAPPISPLIGGTGVATLALAPFGGFALNLAAISAAVCQGPEAHADPARRYTAGIAAGGFYLLLGLFGATVTSLFAAFPAELVMAVAGLALLPTLGGGLADAWVTPAIAMPPWSPSSSPPRASAWVVSVRPSGAWWAASSRSGCCAAEPDRCRRLGRRRRHGDGQLDTGLIGS